MEHLSAAAAAAAASAAAEGLTGCRGAEEPGSRGRLQAGGFLCWSLPATVSKCADPPSGADVPERERNTRAVGRTILEAQLYIHVIYGVSSMLVLLFFMQGLGVKPMQRSNCRKYNSLLWAPLGHVSIS